MGAGGARRCGHRRRVCRPELISEHICFKKLIGGGERGKRERGTVSVGAMLVATRPFYTARIPT